ncbi:conserved hypothetical protein [Sporisorium reilianum SRZ2]|uniref:Telomere length regulation protein conserved domain-containing protein n=1 Tax=Sporisorium reilianum (strain SRZ2) TaxID=999809 RepID=E7A0H2_SPORE|nr:conserved hypothetical protein [Sporisorium reilianum SRZ2]
MDATQTSDARQLRRDFKDIAEGARRFESAEAVLATFTVPLARLVGEDALPPSLKPYAASAGTASSSSAATKADVDVLLVEAAQEALLLRIAVDWTPALDEVHWHDLINSWIFGPPPHPRIQGLIQQCTLRTISRLLPSPNLHPASSALLEQLCIRALSHLSLASLLAAVAGEPNTARADVAWTETLRLLCALPDRLANATRGQLPFTPRTWIERVLVSGLVACLGSAAGQITRLRDVVVRLEKTGYLGQAVDTEGSGFWTAFLRLVPQQQGAGVVQEWVQLRARLGSALRRRLDVGLVETLQFLMGRQGLPMALVAGAERGKAGTEGSAFLGRAAQQGVAAAAVILRTLLSSPTVTAASTSDTDTDTDDDTHASTFTSLALSRTPQSPLLAWSWALSLPAPARHTCLEATLAHWAEPARITRSLLTQELFLTTLIVCLLASLPASTPDARLRLAEIARSRAVLDGVSAHLAHSDAAVHRCGMLVAELLSARTAGEGAKVLRFGSGVWNGTGEGREEVRVLRALGDAWGYHVGVVAEIEAQWGGKGLQEAVKVLGVVAEGGVAQGGEQERAVVERRKAGKPKTRRLPARVAPPSRISESGRPARPLITMLDSDDDDDKGKAVLTTPSPPLKMFSHTQRPSPPHPSSASSSSDDSDSDAAPADDAHSIHRLAASLSGLSPNDASSILGPQPLHPAKPRAHAQTSKLTDLDADRDAHAPQFHTKTATPVYIAQLAPLLRSSSRSDIRLALHAAAPLIQRKRSALFGAEVAENAVDLCLTLVALHDSFGISGFERMRREAVRELAVAQPRVVVGVLAEQSFGSQYSDVQRAGMWVGVVESAGVLAGVGGDVGAERVARDVIRRAQRVGEQGVPQMRRERQLHVAATAGRGRLVQLHDSSAPVQREEEWAHIAGEVYVFPLLHRWLAYHAHRPTHGAGTASLFSPASQTLFLDTLSVLLALAPTHVVHSATPSLLHLLSTSTTASAASQALTCATLTLLALVLDRSLASQPALLLHGDSAARLRALCEFTQDVFALHQADAAGMGIKIQARAAAVLLLVDRVQRASEDEVRRLVGFVP